MALPERDIEIEAVSNVEDAFGEARSDDRDMIELQHLPEFHGERCFIMLSSTPACNVIARLRRSPGRRRGLVTPSCMADLPHPRRASLYRPADS
ncbi:hypothetical protein WHZ78_11725 [Bradyrhizobium symbiodeficiens]|uniref:hypothetical protein n=1 Tax=Bradyrhizobium symbiodeficiens TaxID=1404367 RepID=UPI0030D62C12